MNVDQLPIGISTHRIQAPKLDVFEPVVTGHWPSAETMKQWNEQIMHETRMLIHRQGYPQNPQTESSGYYEIKTNERSVLSLSLLNYAYSGGAHGLTLQKSLTFDAKTGRKVTFGELFKPGSDYIDRLSAIVSGQIKKRNITLLGDFPGVWPDQDFYIADKSLVLYYQLYEITAYVYGFPYFPVSVYELADIVAEDGALGRTMY